MQSQQTQDMVNSPAHYQSKAGYEVADVIEGWGLHQSWHLSDAMKYILRAGKKGGLGLYVQDLQKAIWYLRRFSGRGFSLYEMRFNSVITPEQLIEDFKLSAPVAEAIGALYDLARTAGPPTRTFATTAAAALEREIETVQRIAHAG